MSRIEFLWFVFKHSRLVLTKSKPAMVSGKFLCNVMASSTAFIASVAFMPL